MALFDFFTKRKTGVDHMKDKTSGKGDPRDVTRRQSAGSKQDDGKLQQLYSAGGFPQKIVDRIAKDTVRKWFEIKCMYNGKDLGRLIQNRLDELCVKEKIKEMMTWKGVFNRGSGIYISTSHENQIGKQEEPINKSSLKKIDFINVFDQPDRVNIYIPNTQDVTKADYNKIIYRTNGWNIHKDRIRWVCDSFVPMDREGTSLIQACWDAVVAADNALWSSSTMLHELSMKIFKSKWLVGLSPSQRAEFLYQLAYTTNSQSAIALDETEEYTRLQTGSLTGVKEVFDFVMDNLSGMADISRVVLLGKAHGVVGSDDNEVLNYYSKIEQLQISDVVPILDYLVELILHEKDGEIYRETDGESVKLDWEITPNSLYQLSPKAEAEVRLLNAQADQIDVTIGKASPQEIREKDERYVELAAPTEPVENTPPLDFTPPPTLPPIAGDKKKP